MCKFCIKQVLTSTAKFQTHQYGFIGMVMTIIACLVRCLIYSSLLANVCSLHCHSSTLWHQLFVMLCRVTRHNKAVAVFSFRANHLSNVDPTVCYSSLAGFTLCSCQDMFCTHLLSGSASLPTIPVPNTFAATQFLSSDLIVHGAHDKIACML